MPSVMHNMITDKATGLIFLTVQRHFSLRGAFWHTTVCAMYSSGNYQCPPLCSIFADSLVIARDGFLCVTKIVRIFHGGYLINAEVLFKQFLIHTTA